MYYGNGASTFIAAGIGNVFNFYEGESKLVSGFNVVWFFFFFYGYFYRNYSNIKVASLLVKLFRLNDIEFGRRLCPN